MWIARRFSICLNLSRVLCLLALAGCASTADDYRLGTESTDWYDNSSADPASFGITDAFTFNKKQKRREQNNFKFYYKRCALDDSRTHYSKTSYWCTDPF